MISTVKKSNYFENLDSTRFLGFFHVFLAHCFFTTNPSIQESFGYHLATVNIRSGFLGLDYFFVLSSFLLTWLALKEWQQTESFQPGLFMVRRGLRLWPLYLVLVSGTYGFVYFFGENLGISTLPPIEVFLLFVSNWWIAANGQNFLFLLVFFWSIAVEEQFYVFWAFVLRFLHRNISWVSIGMIIISVVFRAMNLADEPTLYFNTISYLGNFGLGALCAQLAFDNGRFIRAIEQLSKSKIAIVYLVLAILTAGYFRWFQSPLMVVLEKLIFGAFFCFIILEQSFALHSPIKLGKFKRMSYLGQLSLGLYCFHGIVLTFAIPLLKSSGYAETTWQVYVMNPLLILGATLILAWLSFVRFELPIHRYRKYFYPKTSSKTSGV
jgi:peptidoglycan/LPS O-acetylase OafA/YrhL